MTVGSAAWPDHLLSLDEWRAFDVEGRRGELMEGVVIVMPRAGALHQRVAVRLAVSLDRQLPEQWCAVVGVEVVVAEFPATVRAPDVVVVPTVLVEQEQTITAADVLLAVEVVAAGTRGTDRVTKLAEYATAGIPGYWRVEPAEQVIAAYRLDTASGRYELAAAPTRTLTTPLAGLPVSTDVAALLAR